MTSAQAGMGRRFAWVAVLGVMVGLTALFQAFTPGQQQLAETVSSDGKLSVMLRRGRGGHYRAEGQINGHPIRFLVDTGATDIAISDKTARSMALEFGPEIVVMTAAGPAKAWMTRLDEVNIGHLRRTNVRATITPGLGGDALLGMSFLKNFSLQQEGDTLVIEQSGALEP